jgi:hypothetical protein
MTDSTLKESLIRQYVASWTMLRAAINNVDDKRWHKGKGKWHFSETAYHIVETIQFYNREDPEGMRWGGRAGFSWDDVKDVETQVLPRITKDLVRSYLDDVEEEVRNTIEHMPLRKMDEKDGFHWFGSVFEKYLYLLRHTMHHVGELARTLREWELEPARWT